MKIINDNKKVLVLYLVIVVCALALTIGLVYKKSLQVSEYNMPLGDASNSCKTWNTFSLKTTSTAWTQKCDDYSMSDAKSDGARWYRVCTKVTDEKKCKEHKLEAPCYSGYKYYERTCKTCADGFFMVGNGQCGSVCSTGYWRGQNGCEKCPEGYKCDGTGGKVACNNTGEYQDEEGQSYCKKCPSGKMTNNKHTRCYTPNSGGGSDATNNACYKSIVDNSYVFGEYSGDTNYVKISDSDVNCNRVTFTLVDENGNNLQGATFNFEDVSNIANNKSFVGGTFNIETLNSGIYKLKELTSPSGYQLDSNEIAIYVNIDGSVLVSGTNNVDLKNTNGTRNVTIFLKNIKIQKVDEDKCYVMYGNGVDNNYCYGNSMICTGYTVTVDGRNSLTCMEEIMCYQKDDGTFISGKYDKQPGFTYYGKNCPKCYVDQNGKYTWTNSPRSDETLVNSVVKEEDCKAKEACYTNSNGDYFWGAYDDNGDYKKLENVSKENCKKEDTLACYIDKNGEYHWGIFDNPDYRKLDGIGENDCGVKRNNESSGNKTLLYFGIIGVLVIILLVALSMKKKKINTYEDE